MSLRFFLALALAVVHVIATAQEPAPSVTIVSPAADAVVTGETRLAVDVRATRAAVREVTFFVDGIRACVANASALACSSDVGGRLTSRHVRAVVMFDDGSRAVAALRTKGIDIDESVNVDAVVVPVKVTDGRGRFVSNLRREDFRLIEDGEPQAIMALSALDTGADVVLAADVSTSMTPAMTDLIVAFDAFLAALRPQDAVTLVGFNTSLFVIAPRGADPARRSAALGRVRAWGGTALYDAMIRSTELMRGARGRRALVIFTDGDDVSSRGSPDAARASLQANDVVLYALAQGKATEDDELRERLRSISVETGGAAYFASRLSSLRDEFASIVDDITHQYVLSYVPRRPLGDGGWREIRVELTGKRHDVRARQGYLAVRRESVTPP